ncbi:HpnA protein [Prolixibacter bellariivorans]|uniref:HpnA protein n=1 Tax=Prolixibacter bellariivorans TaxID=314319 RepID=A0A5M4AUP6_9BACT|nr:NAD-dependent epimerase/dehydratase family protein [Prolixibacter bellariivorans]GET31147.1 HpnA protein [Prolixibacter bellariivorans]
MNVLVTGANGLLGSHVVRKLAEQKFAVRAMVREGSNRKALEGVTCVLFEGRITDKEEVERAVSGCDYVIHVAAKTSQAPSNVEAFYKTNIESTRYLIDACLRCKVKRFVFVSSANCFGNGTKSAPGNEQKPFMPWLKKSGYAYSKLLAQQMVLQEIKQQLNAVVVNPTFMIGDNDTKPSSGRIFFHVLKKPVIFYPPGGKNFVDVETAAQGVVNAMLNGKRGECYLLAGENLSYLEFFKMITGVVGQKSVFIQIPSWVLKTAGFVGDMLEKIFHIPIQLTAVNAKMLCENNFYTAQKAMNEIDFEMTPIYQSIEKTILWFRKNNYIK